MLASVFVEKPVRQQSLVLLTPGEQTSFNNIYLSNCFTLQLFAKTKYQNPSEIHNSFLYHASLRTEWSDLIHGRKIQMDLISWPRGCFFPSLFTHIAYFHSRFMGIIILRYCSPENESLDNKWNCLPLTCHIFEFPHAHEH